MDSADQATIKAMLDKLQPGGFDPWTLLASFVFGVIGFYAFLNGKKTASWKRMIIGVLLMIYPYFVTGTLATCLVGLGLCGLLYLWKD